MKLPKIVVLFYLIFSISLSAMEAIPPSVIPPENIIRLIFLGTTGCGKSTTINAFFNFTKNVKWDAFPKLFPIKTLHQPCNVPEYFGRNTENTNGDRFAVVTQESSEYTATGEKLILNMVDYPGIGLDRYDNITDIAQILKGAGYFNAICLVKMGGIRVTAEELYLVEQLKTIIPVTERNRLFILLTFTTTISEEMEAFVSSAELPLDNIFAFDHFPLSKEGHVSVTGINFTGDDSENKEAKFTRAIRSKWVCSERSFIELIIKARDLGKYSTWFWPQVRAFFEGKEDVGSTISELPKEIVLLILSHL
jgi:hypothetical protein